jgi:hypothetical protein
MRANGAPSRRPFDHHQHDGDQGRDRSEQSRSLVDAGKEMLGERDDVFTFIPRLSYPDFD